MPYEWDPGKAAANLAKHGVSFEAVEQGFEWADVVVEADTRYGEVRLRATGFLGGRLHVVVYAIPRRAIRLISARPANRKEVKKYNAP